MNKRFLKIENENRIKEDGGWQESYQKENVSAENHASVKSVLLFSSKSLSRVFIS
jgi:hypothetical protein